MRLSEPRQAEPKPEPKVIKKDTENKSESQNKPGQSGLVTLRCCGGGGFDASREKNFFAFWKNRVVTGLSWGLTVLVDDGATNTKAGRNLPISGLARLGLAGEKLAFFLCLLSMSLPAAPFFSGSGSLERKVLARGLSTRVERTRAACVGVRQWLTVRLTLTTQVLGSYFFLSVS